MAYIIGALLIYRDTRNLLFVFWSGFFGLVLCPQSFILFDTTTIAFPLVTKATAYPFDLPLSSFVAKPYERLK